MKLLCRSYQTVLFPLPICQLSLPDLYIVLVVIPRAMPSESSSIKRLAERGTPSEEVECREQAESDSKLFLEVGEAVQAL